jgi:hypothetical protein
MIMALIKPSPKYRSVFDCKQVRGAFMYYSGLEEIGTGKITWDPVGYPTLQQAEDRGISAAKAKNEEAQSD